MWFFLEELIKVGMIFMEEKRCFIYVYDINVFFGGVCRDNVMKLLWFIKYRGEFVVW